MYQNIVKVQQTFSYMRVTCFDLAMQLLEAQERIRLSHQFNAQKNRHIEI